LRNLNEDIVPEKRRCPRAQCRLCDFYKSWQHTSDKPSTTERPVRGKPGTPLENGTFASRPSSDDVPACSTPAWYSCSTSCMALHKVLLLMFPTTIGDHPAATTSLQRNAVAKPLANVTHGRVEEVAIIKGYCLCWRYQIEDSSALTHIHDRLLRDAIVLVVLEHQAFPDSYLLSSGIHVRLNPATNKA
ncbi:hypothetical protein DBV15_05641, partial [Temnothorax longispinosus]